MILIAIFILSSCSEKTENTVGTILLIMVIVSGLSLLYFENNDQNNKYDASN